MASNVPSAVMVIFADVPPGRSAASTVVMASAPLVAAEIVAVSPVDGVITIESSVMTVEPIVKSVVASHVVKVPARAVSAPRMPSILVPIKSVEVIDVAAETVPKLAIVVPAKVLFPRTVIESPVALPRVTASSKVTACSKVAAAPANRSSSVPFSSYSTEASCVVPKYNFLSSVI